MSISPFITQLINFGEKSLYVAIPGLFIYFAEFFAFKYKLKMIRLRSEAKRVEHQKLTGEYLPEPHITPALWFAVGMRIVFRMGCVAICATAVGIDMPDYGGKPLSVAIILITLLVEVLSLAYLYSNNTLFWDFPDNVMEAREEKKEDDAWRKENLDRQETVWEDRKEIISDVILQIYAFMIFTAFWEYINQLGINLIDSNYKHNDPAIATAMELSMMLLVMVSVGLLPMRLAYWIEESVEAISKKEKRIMAGYFVIAVLLTITPSVREYIDVYFRK